MSVERVSKGEEDRKDRPATGRNIIFRLSIFREDFFDIRNQGSLQFKKNNSAVDICAVIG